MAERKILSFIIDLKDRASGGLKSFGGNLTRTFKVAAKAILAGVAALTAFTVALGALALQGGKVLSVQRAFSLVTGDVEGALVSLTAASRGLISNYELMAGFNRALTLGAADNVEQFAELTEVALTLGRALGVDAAFAMESLSLGIGRQSRLFLDNLGLIISVEKANKDYAAAIGKTTAELTQQEQKLAFRNAAMDAAAQKIEELGGVELNAADAVTQFKVAVENARDEIGMMLAQSPLLEEFFTGLSEIVNGTIRILNGGAPAIRIAAGELGIIAGNAFAAAWLKAMAIRFIPVPGPLLKILDFIAEPMRRMFADSADDAVDNVVAAIERLRTFVANLPDPPKRGVARRDPGPDLPEFEPREMRFAQQQKDILVFARTKIPEITDLVLDLLEAWQQVGFVIADTDTQVDSMVNGLTAFSAAMGQGLAQWIEGTKTLGQAIKGAFLGALAAVAATFQRFYLAQAAGALAAGIAGDPRGFAAAAKYAGAAVLMGVVAGVASSGAAGGGGGGFGGTDVRFPDRFSGAGGVRGGTIIIQGGILDMSDPRQADAFSEALEDILGMRRGAITITQE